MSFKPFKWVKSFSPNAYKIAAVVLLAVVVIETALLVRYYSQESKSRKFSREAAQQIKKAAKKTATAKKIKPSAPAKTQRLTPPTVAGPQPGTPRTSRGKIAIIVDDSGYNIKDCDHLQSIGTPVTVSILPDLEHSTDIAKCAHGYQKEVMLHLPLEPHENSDEYPKNYIINTEMPKRLIIDRFEQSLRSVPYADGINNHMGSKATENKRLMSIIFNELEDKKLFFVDSRVTSKTITLQLARETGLPYAQRDVFLDNVNQRPEIEKQFAELARTAEEQGAAIGIGHARQLTWDIIKEQTEKLTMEGFEIVPVRSLVNRQ